MPQIASYVMPDEDRKTVPLCAGQSDVGWLLGAEAEAAVGLEKPPRTHDWYAPSLGLLDAVWTCRTTRVALVPWIAVSTEAAVGSRIPCKLASKDRVLVKI